MFTGITSNAPNWIQQKNHAFSFNTRLLLIRHSLVYRRPIENRTRIERISNERRTKEERENDGKPSKT